MRDWSIRLCGPIFGQRLQGGRGNPDCAVSLYSGGYCGGFAPVMTSSVSTPSPSLASLISSVLTPSQTR